MDRRETERLLAAIRQARALGEPAALATVVRVTGSAYRREGTRMFVRQDGTLRVRALGRVSGTDRRRGRRARDCDRRAVDRQLRPRRRFGLGPRHRLQRRRRRPHRAARRRCAVDAHGWAMLERGEAGRAGHAALRRVRADASCRGRRGEIVGGLSDPAIEREAVARAREQLGAPFPQSGPGADRRQPSSSSSSATPPPDARDLRRRIRRRAAGAAGLDARLHRHRRRRPRGIPDRRSLSAAPRSSSAHFSQFADAVPLGPASFALVMNHHSSAIRRACASRSIRTPPTSACSDPRSRFRQAARRPGRTGLCARPRRASRACGARLAWRSAPRRRTKWRCPSSAKSWRSAADSTAGFSAARVGSLHRPDRRGGSWRSS